MLHREDDVFRLPRQGSGLRRGRFKKVASHLARLSLILVEFNRRAVPGIHGVRNHLFLHGGLRLANRAESKRSFPDQFCCAEWSLDLPRAIQQRETRPSRGDFQTYMT